ncbi:hypothetical protein WJX82_004857 [Trebouxia sp. C0006]
MYTPLCTSLQKALPPVSSTTGGLASVIDAALGMLLGSETSGTWPASLSVVVLRLASEEQRTFTLATLPIHHDFWVSTLLLLIEALQQHAGHRLGGILVILSAILLQQFEGNVISLDAAQMHSAVSRGIHSASQQRQQQPEMALQDRAGTAEVSSSLRRALWHRQRLTVPEYEQLQEHMMAWYANEVWAAGHPSRGRVFQCTDYWCARADKIA